MLWRCIIAGTKERFEGQTPPQHPQHYIRLLGGSSPINLKRQNEAQCLVWGVRGAFPPSAAMVVTLFCSLPEHEPLFPVEPRHSGYRQKALVSSKMILELYWGGDVETTEKRREMGNKHLSPTPYARLVIPARILRIPVFSAPVALFSQESRFLFLRNFFGAPSVFLSVWACVG